MLFVSESLALYRHFHKPPTLQNAEKQQFYSGQMATKPPVSGLRSQEHCTVLTSNEIVIATLPNKVLNRNLP